MERRAKVELFEEIRREHEFGIGTIKGVARKLGVHRRMVRQALANAQPPERRRTERERRVVGPLIPFINAILEGERDPQVLAGMVMPGVKATPEDIIKSLEGTGAMNYCLCCDSTWSSIDSIRRKSPIATGNCGSTWSRWGPK